MSPFIQTQISPPASELALGPPHPTLSPEAVLFRERFGVTPSIWNGETGTRAFSAQDEPLGDESYLGSLVRAVAAGSEPQFLCDEAPVLLLAIPFHSRTESTKVAVAAFATSAYARSQPLADAARLLDMRENALANWLAAQTPWPAEALLKMAKGLQAEVAANARAERAEFELDRVSEGLARSYEEISLLFGLTQHLRISSSDTEIGEVTLEWLADCLSATGAAIQYLPVATKGETTYQARTRSVLCTWGELPFPESQFDQFIASLELNAISGPIVMNRPNADKQLADWPGVHQAIVAPLAEGNNLLGYLVAFNHRQELEFGTDGASLLGSVGTILGIHSGNFDLYRRQAEFLAGVVRALTSAIDAKDQYTCGHSDRVARIAVRLAQELDCNRDILPILYMGGLLHDIGKIGIDDRVLRNPNPLSEEEFNHIKLHPELGHKILSDLRELHNVIPVVLHHHEQWDGKGYPHQLSGENIPFLARVVAVADAYDAMTSDRPYRKGMPIEKVETIFRRGAGQQWDSAVIDAYFRCREDIRVISQQIRANLSLDLQQWS